MTETVTIPRDLAARALAYLEDHHDCGPPGQGYPSDQLVKDREAFAAALAAHPTGPGEAEPVAGAPTVDIGVLRGDNSDYVVLVVEPKDQPVRKMRLSIGGADVLLAELGGLLYGEPAPTPPAGDAGAEPAGEDDPSTPGYWTHHQAAYLCRREAESDADWIARLRRHFFAPTPPAGDAGAEPAGTLSPGDFGLIVSEALRVFALAVEASPQPERPTIETFSPRFEAIREASQAIMSAAFRLAAAPPLNTGPEVGGGGEDLAEACKPWEFAVGGPPDYDSPLHQVFVAGMLYSEKLLAGFLDVSDYQPGDGSEDFDADATMSLQNILTAAGLYDPEDGRRATLSPAPAEAGEDLARLSARATQGEWHFRCAKPGHAWIADAPEGRRHSKIILGKEAFYGGDADYAFVAAVVSAYRSGALLPAASRPAADKGFDRGQRVRKVSGSSWQGTVVGHYSTDLTPDGICVESEREPGSVQIYPAKALALLDPRDDTRAGGDQAQESGR